MEVTATAKNGISVKITKRNTMQKSGGGGGVRGDSGRGRGRGDGREGERGRRRGRGGVSHG